MTIRHVMDGPDHRNRLDEMAQGLIGTPLDRPDGSLKVTGQATYAADWQLDKVVYGVLVRGAAASGSVSSVAAGDIENLPGIVAVIADERLIRNPAQGTANQAPVQGPTDVAYFGQPVALVVAETFEQARHGAEAVEVMIEAGDAVVDPEADTTPTEERGASAIGDLELAMQDAAYTVDATYRTPPHSSAPMEPHAATAQWEGDELVLRGSYQMLKYNRSELADALGIDAAKVRLLAPYVGGGFGSKLGISHEAVAAAIAARQLDRPVSVALTRQQVFEATMRRSESRQRIRLAADKDGALIGIGHESLVSNLPGEVFSEPVEQATHFAYRGAHRKTARQVARVNRTCAGSVRAPGEAIGMTVLENAMDELAHATGIDPVELRKLNIPERHPGKDQEFSSRRFADVLDRGAETFGWSKRSPTPGARREGEWLIGMGMASLVRVNTLAESKAEVSLKPDGTAIVETDMTDIGTGTYAILTQIAGEALGLPAHKVAVRLGDTDLPAASGSGGSWGAASSGASVLLACEEVRRQLCRRLACDEADLTLKDGEAMVANQRHTLTSILNGDQLTGEGHIEPGAASEARRQASYGACFSEVAVSAVTGETRICRMQGTIAAGRILNVKTARSQCVGGMIWGIGIALTEELLHDPRDGHVVNRDLAEYHLPVNLDVPRIDIEFLKERDAWANPLQAKGLGELGISGSAAAVTNAIFNATGVRVRDYPATLDKVFAGLMA